MKGKTTISLWQSLTRKGHSCRCQWQVTRCSDGTIASIRRVGSRTVSPAYNSGGVSRQALSQHREEIYVWTKRVRDVVSRVHLLIYLICATNTTALCQRYTLDHTCISKSTDGIDERITSRIVEPRTPLLHKRCKAALIQTTLRT